MKGRPKQQKRGHKSDSEYESDDSDSQSSSPSPQEPMEVEAMAEVASNKRPRMQVGAEGEPSQEFDSIQEVFTPITLNSPAEVPAPAARYERSHSAPVQDFSGLRLRGSVDMEINPDDSKDASPARARTARPAVSEVSEPASPVTLIGAQRLLGDTPDKARD